VAIAPYLKKGQLVYVEGSPEVRTFTRNDGSSGASLTLRVLNVQLLGSARGGESQEGQGFAQRGQLDAPKVESPEVSSVEDDLPF
jgi:single-strand DNA-binding protein